MACCPWPANIPWPRWKPLPRRPCITAPGVYGICALLLERAGPSPQLDFLETHPLIRSLDAYEALTPDCFNPQPKTVYEQLENTLKQLRLSGLLQTLDVRLQEAAANRLGHAEFLELICQDEINVRQQRLMERRTKAADFRSLKTLEDFDWSFNPSIHRKDIYDLATGNFIRQAKDVLFLGPPGVGKTHLGSGHGL
jgi:hypothetical protein